MKRSVSVVVPIYNEDGPIEELADRLSSVLSEAAESHQIIFVDDGSTDNSLEKLLQIQSKFTEVVVVQLSRNYGQTAALAAGIDHASYDVIITMDGDLQHTPEDIPRFLEKLEEGYDIVSGWRETRTDNYFLRRFPSRCANGLMRLMSGLSIRDFGSTYKAYRSDLVKRIELFGELHRFIPVLANRLGAKIVEIPIEVHPRSEGESSYGLGRTFGVFEDIIFLEFYSNYLTKPIRAFGKLFLVFFGIGFAICSFLLLLWLVGSIENLLERGAMLILGVFLMIVGVQFLVAGVLAELLTRIYMNTSNRKIYSVREIHGDL